MSKTLKDLQIKHNISSEYYTIQSCLLHMMERAEARVTKEEKKPIVVVKNVLILKIKCSNVAIEYWTYLSAVGWNNSKELDRLKEERTQLQNELYWLPEGIKPL
jgi:hypothetical protein